MPVSLKFVHSTPAQNLAELRKRFKAATGIKAARIARFLLTLTDTQLRSAFGLTSAQVAALRSRLETRAASLTTAESQEGE